MDLNVVGLQAGPLLIWAKTWAYNHLGPLAGLNVKFWPAAPENTMGF